MNYSFIEEADFEKSKNEIAEARSIDEAIEATIRGLQRNPYNYDESVPHERKVPTKIRRH